MKNTHIEKIEEMMLEVERGNMSSEDAIDKIGEIVVQHKFNNAVMLVGYQAVKELSR